MSEKMICPACDAYTSSVLQAFEEGEPCPSCALPALVAAEIVAARARGADAKLIKNYQESTKRERAAEARARELEWRLKEVRLALEAEYPDGSPW